MGKKKKQKDKEEKEKKRRQEEEGGRKKSSKKKFGKKKQDGLRYLQREPDRAKTAQGRRADETEYMGPGRSARVVSGTRPDAEGVRAAVDSARPAADGTRTVSPVQRTAAGTVRTVRSGKRPAADRTRAAGSGTHTAAERFRALGDENRLQILALLKETEMCAGDLLKSLSIVQSTLSHHMKTLTDTGIVTCRRQGKWSYYSINRTLIPDLDDLLGKWGGGQSED